MNQIKIIFWSQSGNTQSMADAIAKGVKAKGVEAVVLPVGTVQAEELKDESVFALGCPAMGAEVLEEGEMEPFVSEVEQFASGKKIVLFGSYGWGDGQWMRDWEERMRNAGAEIVNDEGIICQEAPDDATLVELENLGEIIASL